MEYAFTLKYRLPETADNSDALVEQLGAAGCDDAVIGIGQPGRIGLEFIRDANSAHEAMITAVADVRRAIPEAELIEAAPDFVGLSDVAEVVGMTRQNMQKLRKNNFHHFPAPVHEGSAAVWHLADILHWLTTKGSYALEASLLEVATTAMHINLARESRRRSGAISHEVWELIA